MLKGGGMESFFLSVTLDFSFSFCFWVSFNGFHVIHQQ